MNEDGNATTIAMEPLKAVEWMKKHLELGIFGVRFNQGNHGWLMPIVNLESIYKYLTDLKLL